MSREKKKTAASVEGQEGDVRSQGEPNLDVRAMIRILMEEQMKAEGERAEARRVADADRIRAENERAEARRIADAEREAAAAEARRLADSEREAAAREARRLDEAAKELAAKAAAQRHFEQQEALATKQYEQQVALMRMQADIGERAARSHRDEQSVDRKRDRAIASIPNFRDGDDVEEFLLTAERRIRAGEIKEGEWVTILASKLCGKMGSVWQDICVTVEKYQEVKERVLKVCGYTPKLAAEVFYGFKK